jgi:Zn-dependent protease
VFLSAPGKTPYDMNFTILGFPCRVHPAFFILPVLFSNAFMTPGLNAGVVVLIVAAVFFIGILVHELGHTLAFRYFGVESSVVLYWMGGLAIPGGGTGSWSGGRTRSLKPNEQIIVSLAGPVAGLLLALFFTAILVVLSGGIHINWLGPFPIPWENSTEGTILADSPSLLMFIRASIIINIILNLFNLLPVYPLDGGQIARQLFVKVDPWAGVRKSAILSMCVAVFVALVALKNGDTFMAIFFGYMAWSNYQSLTMGAGGGGRRPW